MDNNVFIYNLLIQKIMLELWNCFYDVNINLKPLLGEVANFLWWAFIVLHDGFADRWRQLFGLQNDTYYTNSSRVSLVSNTKYGVSRINCSFLKNHWVGCLPGVYHIDQKSVESPRSVLFLPAVWPPKFHNNREPRFAFPSSLVKRRKRKVLWKNGLWNGSSDRRVFLKAIQCKYTSDFHGAY